MTIRKFATSAAVVALLGASALGYAWAQASYPLPTYTTVTSVNGSADLIPIMPNGSAGPRQVFILPFKNNLVSGYYTSVPSTGFTYTFGTNVKRANFEPTTTLSTGTVTLPVASDDGREACVYSKNAITTLTLNAGTGQTVNDAVTTLAAAAHACYQFGLSNLTWNRSE